MRSASLRLDVRSTVLAMGLVVLATAPCLVTAEASQTAAAEPPGPGLVLLAMAGDPGALERPQVPFNHRAHAEALAADGCTACHLRDEQGRIVPELALAGRGRGRAGLMDAYHGLCVDCHVRRSAAAQKTGPVTCGGCHVREPAVAGARAALRFDYSLHGRHSKAYPEDCGGCHHVWNQSQARLVYRKGAEDACRACHGPVAVKDRPSLRTAVHTSCVNCHMTRAVAGQPAGPATCRGCHVAGVLDAVERLEEVPRIQRGQPDTLWVPASGGRTAVVPFDHLGHEGVTDACSDCHHIGLDPCAKCHEVRVSPSGGGVSRERAYHHVSSATSCVGCHERETAATDCVGCHQLMPSAAVGSGCATCHRGPSADRLGDPPPPVQLSSVELAPLPTTADELPDEVVIDVLVDQYEPSRLPHRKIVTRLDAGIRSSKLARTFHGTTEAMCSGCHHRTPAGSEPARCGSCHGLEGSPSEDRPGLKAAYHRQCLGCHERMGLPKQGCTDCHAQRAAAEVDS